MAKQVIGTPVKVGETTIPLSKAIRAGDFVFVSGQLPMTAQGPLLSGSIEEQTRASIENIKAVLSEAGCSLADVVKTTVWLTDRRDFAAFNRVYAEYFASEPPARSTVESPLMIDCKIEIEAVAYKPR